MSLSGWIYNSDDESVGYKELASSGKGSINPETGSVERHFKVRWANLNSFLDDLLGWSYLNPNPPASGPYAIKRILPDEHPKFPLFFASDASFDGTGQPNHDTNTITWDFAKIAVTYKPLDYAVKADGSVDHEWERFLSCTSQFQSEAMTIQQAMKFVHTKKAFTGAIAKPSFLTTLTLTWMGVPAWNDDPFRVPTEDKIKNCVGKINNAAWTIGPRRTYPAGTLLFLGCDAKLQTPRLGGNFYSWNLAYQFAYRDNGLNKYGEQSTHNFLYDVTEPTSPWDLVTSNGETSGTTIYESADLTQLFTIGA